LVEIIDRSNSKLFKKSITTLRRSIGVDVFHVEEIFNLLEENPEYLNTMLQDFEFKLETAFEHYNSDLLEAVSIILGFLKSNVPSELIKDCSFEDYPILGCLISNEELFKLLCLEIRISIDRKIASNRQASTSRLTSLNSRVCADANKKVPDWKNVKGLHLVPKLKILLERSEIS
jgi:hypothetical protein